MTGMLAQSPKYPALYDAESGVRFIRGRAEVTEEQARALTKRRFMDGILVEGVPAKKWAPADDPPPEPDAPDVSADAPPLPEPPVDPPAGSGKRSRR